MGSLGNKDILLETTNMYTGPPTFIDHTAYTFNFIPSPTISIGDDSKKNSTIWPHNFYSLLRVAGRVGTPRIINTRDYFIGIWL